MKIITNNFETIEGHQQLDMCIFVDECSRNSCDCEYNCSRDDDCTQDSSW